MNEACRINKPMAYERPTPELRGAGGRNYGKTGQIITPRPLERRVGLPLKKEKAGFAWLLLFIFPDMLIINGV